MPHLTPCSCPPHLLQLPAHDQALVRIVRPTRPRPRSRPTAPNSLAERPQILPVRLQPHRQADDPVHRPRRAHVRRGRQAHRARWAADDLQRATRGWAEEGHLERLSDAPLLLRRWRCRPGTMSRRGAGMARFDTVRVPRSLRAANRPQRSGTRRMDRSSDHFDLALTARSIRHSIRAVRRLVDLGGTPLRAESCAISTGTGRSDHAQTVYATMHAIHYMLIQFPALFVPFIGELALGPSSRGASCMMSPTRRLSPSSQRRMRVRI